nr:speckle type POZ protein [Hymenolepis microstoma]
MIRRESRQTCTHVTNDIAIQASDENSSSDKDDDHEREVYDFREPFLFSDMVLLVENEKLHCHRAILSLYSPVFKAMFQSRFEETTNNQVSLPKDDAETVRELLRHLYTPGGCDMDSAAAQRLLPLIHRFQIDSLITIAERTMTFSMTDSMAPKMLALADMYQLNHLKQAAIDACTRLDMKRMAEAMEETPLSPELKSIVFANRVMLLEKVISDIERSFSQSCIRMESKLERVFTNHCQVHSKPLSATTVPVTVQLTGSPSDTPDRLNIRPVDTHTTEPSTGNRPSTRALHSNASDIDVPTAVEQSVPVLRTVERPANTTVVEVPAICENCVERISTHIKDLCRRALHKAQFVPYRPPNTAVTTISSNTPTS